MLKTKTGVAYVDSDDIIGGQNIYINNLVRD